MSSDSKEGTRGGRVVPKGCLLGDGRYPCVARGSRGRSHGGDVGRNLGAEIHIIGVSGGQHSCGAGQAEVGVCGRNDRVTATATRNTVSKMPDAMDAGWGTSPNNRGWRS